MKSVLILLTVTTGIWAQNGCQLLSNGWLGCTSLPSTCSSGVSPDVYLYSSQVVYVCAGNTYVPTSGASQVALAISPITYGAVGDNTHDDTSAIVAAIAACNPGGTVSFTGAGYKFKISSTIILANNCSYIGEGATINQVTPNLFAFLVPSGGNHISVKGINFTGAGISGNATNSSIDISKNTFGSFLNVAGNPSAAVYFGTSNAVGVVIAQNTFNTVPVGIVMFSPSNVDIWGNVANGIAVSDFISITNNDAGHISSGVNIHDNKGSGLFRMAIEVTGQYQTGLQIWGNNFYNWLTTQSAAAFGISVSTGGSTGAKIYGNTLVGTVNNGYGIEIGDGEAVVTDNYISGFVTGLVVQGVSNVTVANNTSSFASSMGITLSNAGANKHTLVTGNHIISAQNNGIFQDAVDACGSEITGNDITRGAGDWAGDASTTFDALIFQPSQSCPSKILNNTVFETATVTVGSFVFIGMNWTGTTAGNVFQGNFIGAAASGSVVSCGVQFPSNIGNSSIVAGNTFSTLLETSCGGAAGASSLINGNIAVAVVNNDSTLTSNPIVQNTLYSAAGIPLPTCNAGTKGNLYTVSDATSPTYMTAYTSGGGITAAVICSYNGSSYAWLNH